MNRAARLVGVALICGGTALMGSPLDAHHSIDFDSYSCADVEPSPPADASPQPTEPGEGEQPPPGEEPTPAPQNCMPEEGERIWGTRVVRFTTSTDGSRPFKRVALYILSEEEGIPHAAVGEPVAIDTFSRGEDVRSYDSPFTWNSPEATPYNGRYKIRVEADTYPPFTGNEPHRATRERQRLLVDNPPKAVSAPEIIAATVTTVTVQWAPATELDVLSYTVYRAKAASKTEKPTHSEFRQVGSSTGTTYRDRATPGLYRYTVRVNRRSVVTPETGISSPMSAMSGVAEVKSLTQINKEADDEDDGNDAPPPPPPPLRRLSAPPVGTRLANVPDAPFAYKLPYDRDVGSLDAPVEGGSTEGGANDPRGGVLPVAVGMFLLSSALAVGRMPY